MTRILKLLHFLTCCEHILQKYLFDAHKMGTVLKKSKVANKVFFY